MPKDIYSRTQEVEMPSDNSSSSPDDTSSDDSTPTTNLPKEDQQRLDELVDSLSDDEKEYLYQCLDNCQEDDEDTESKDTVEQGMDKAFKASGQRNPFNEGAD